MKFLLLVALFAACTYAASLDPVCVAPYGVWDDNAELCSCFSGYHDGINGECMSASGCAGLIVNGNAAAEYAPRAPKISFFDDAFTIVQRTPIVKGRLNSTITLQKPDGTPAAVTCNYPGDLWTKTTDSLDCFDVFTATIPWSQHDMCGFHLSGTVDSYLVYASALVHKFTDVHTHNGKTVMRDGSAVNTMTVKFATQLKTSIPTASIEGASPDGSPIDVEITSNGMTDPTTKDVHIGFQTQVQPPFIIGAGDISVSWTPASGNNIPAGAAPTFTIVKVNDPSLSCASQDQTCAQAFDLDIHPDTITNFKGVLTITVPVKCREGDAVVNCNGGSSPLLESFTISFTEDTDVLGNADLVASQLSASALAYTDASWTVPVTEFQVGEVAYVEVKVLDKEVSLDSVTIDKVMLGETVLYNSATGVKIATVLRESNKLTPPNSPTYVEFSFALTRALTGITPASPSATVDVSVTLDIEYHSNDKRSVKNSVQKEAVLSLRLTEPRTPAHANAPAHADAPASTNVVADETTNAVTSASTPLLTPALTVLLACVLAMLF